MPAHRDRPTPEHQHRRPWHQQHTLLTASWTSWRLACCGRGRAGWASGWREPGLVMDRGMGGIIYGGRSQFSNRFAGTLATRHGSEKPWTMMRGGETRCVVALRRETRSESQRCTPRLKRSRRQGEGGGVPPRFSVFFYLRRSMQVSRPVRAARLQFVCLFSRSAGPPVSFESSPLCRPAGRRGRASATSEYRPSSVVRVAAARRLTNSKG